MKKFDHQAAHAAYRRARLKNFRDFCWRYAIAFFLCGAVFGKVSQRYEAYEACFSGLLLALLFWGASKILDQYIAAYDRRQQGIVRNIWQQ